MSASDEAVRIPPATIHVISMFIKRNVSSLAIPILVIKFNAQQGKAKMLVLYDL